MQTLQASVQKAKAALLAAAPRITETYAQTILALVTLRVQNEGIDARYSTNQVPTFFFASKALNSGGRAYVKQNKLGTWEGFRVAQGLPGGRVRLTYTARMFRSLTVMGAGGMGTVFRAKIVAADRESADKVKHNQVRYGDFLKPTIAEVAAGRDYVRGESGRIIQQSLGA